MNAVVDDDGLVEGSAQPSEVFNVGTIDVAAVLAVKSGCEVAVLGVEDGDHLVGVVPLRSELAAC